MIAGSERVRIDGHLLHRMVFTPEKSVEVRACAIFYHGQGDYAERYTDVLDVFTRRGIKCIITELRGHGHSPGRRGHCGDEQLLNAVVLDTLEEIGDVPYGVMGHSMGGLLALRHLILAGRGQYAEPSFAWLSSPLVRPSARRSKWFKTALRFLAPMMPSLTVNTGVTPQMCRVKSDDPDQPPPPPKHQLWHRRVSIGWGAALLDIEQLVNEHAEEVSASLPLIYTQGAEDPVCPVETAREFFSKLADGNSEYHEFEGMLHEPFNGEGNDKLFAALQSWLDQLDLGK